MDVQRFDSLKMLLFTLTFSGFWISCGSQPLHIGPAKSLCILSGNSVTIPCENFYEISPRSRRVFGRRDFLISPRSRHRAEITAEIAGWYWREIAARSRRDTGNLGGQKLAAISPRSRRDSRRDRSEIWVVKWAQIAHFTSFWCEASDWSRAFGLWLVERLSWEPTVG